MAPSSQVNCLNRYSMYQFSIFFNFLTTKYQMLQQILRIESRTLNSECSPFSYICHNIFASNSTGPSLKSSLHVSSITVWFDFVSFSYEDSHSLSIKYLPQIQSDKYTQSIRSVYILQSATAVSITAVFVSVLCAQLTCQKSITHTCTPQQVQTLYHTHTHTNTIQIHTPPQDRILTVNLHIDTHKLLRLVTNPATDYTFVKSLHFTLFLLSLFVLQQQFQISSALLIVNLLTVSHSYTLPLVQYHSHYCYQKCF